MDNILQIKNNSFEKIEIKKSKFFCFSFVVNSKEQIDSILLDLGKQYADATHICYAYRCMSQEKACDNGEPQGTAGKPILDCIKHKNLQNVLVVVVRYFGGIKLGAGGLVRAYSNCAKTVLEISGTAESTACHKFDLKVDFSQQKILQLLLQNPLIVKSQTKYDQNICVELFCKTADKSNLVQLVFDLFGTDKMLTTDDSTYFV